MRVLHVVASARRRGAETFAADLIPHLERVGASQRVAVLRCDEPDLDFGVPTAVLGSETRSSLAPSRLRALKRLVDAWRPDVIQAHGGEPLKYLVPALWSSDHKIVYRKIGLTPDWMARGARRALHAQLIRRADAVVAVADAVRRESIESFGVDPSRVVTIPNGVEPGRVEARRDLAELRRALGVSSRSPVLLFAGAFTWEKDPLAVIAALRPLLNEDDGPTLLIAGDGVLRPEVEAAAGECRVGRVLLLGSRSDVGDLLALCDVLVMTSRTEGMPAIAIEAGLVGRPVAAFDVGGVGEVVIDGDTGVIVPSGDLEGLARGVSLLLGDAALARRMGESALERCRATYDMSVVASRYASLYEELAAGTVVRA